MNLSLRRKLLLTLLSLTAVIWLLTAYSSYRDTRHEIEELFDAQMAQTARTLLSVAGHELIELSGTPLKDTHIHFSGETSFTAGGHEYEHKLAYQLWQQPQKRLLLRSFSAPEEALSDGQDGYSTRQINGEQWRVFSLLDNTTGFQIQVGEALSIRQELTNLIALRTGIPLLIALPLLALLISLGVTRTLKPLRSIADAITRRAPHNLERVEEHHVPAEIVPLVEALNRLLERLSRAFENERRFTADAAHELRTPLASLKVHAQVARRSDDSAERTRALDKVLEGVDHATRLVEQLLTLARMEPGHTPPQTQLIELDQLAEGVMSEHAGEAAMKNIELDFRSCPHPFIEGMRDGIEILLRNLLDNAIRYSPEGGRVIIIIERSEERELLLRVADSGEGIPEAEQERIFERFYRLAGQGSRGSGLGLSIVKRIAELNQGSVTLTRSPLGGLEVTVRFPERAP